MFFLMLYLCENFAYPSLMIVTSQSVELTSEAVEFLKGIFSTFDDDKVCFVTVLLVLLEWVFYCSDQYGSLYD